jgi:RNA-directed DNA polymerase
MATSDAGRISTTLTDAIHRGLPSLHDRVGRLQTSLQAKAKAEPAYRFYTLWDKVCRADVLAEAYRRCRANRGTAGVDGETFAAIEADGVEAWLEGLRQELRSRAYRPQPLLRVWIPKNGGGRRPLGIPTIRDRVVQAAMVIVLEPIFEADLLPNQYGFRPRLDAKMAVRRAYWHITDGGRTEVVDADLRDYFDHASCCPPREPSSVSNASRSSSPARSFCSRSRVLGASGNR